MKFDCKHIPPILWNFLNPQIFGVFHNKYWPDREIWAQMFCHVEWSHNWASTHASVRCMETGWPE